MFRHLRSYIGSSRSSCRTRVLFVSCFGLLVVAGIFHNLGFLTRNSKIYPASLTLRKNHASIAAGNETLQARPIARTKLILYWTSFFDWKDYGMGYGNTPFQNCPVSSCITTGDRRLLKDSDALIFHPVNMKLSDTPPFRQPHQLWIFYLLEPPRNTPPLDKFGNFYNWTMTYRLDSDIYIPYGALGPVPVGNQSQSYLQQSSRTTKWTADIYQFRQMRNSTSFDYDLFIKTKKKSVAWFVSNCFSSNDRGGYVRELAQYIDVDIYGKCGNLTCKDNESCFKMVGRDYKFYLSFENSICIDYVTEKLFNALKNGVVPVVFGVDAHRRIAPPNSFIDADAFESPKALAEYLHTLIRNDTLYKEYLKWNDNFEPIWFNRWCQLCKMLNDPDLVQKQSTYADINDWWVNKAKCKNKSPSKLRKRT